VTYTAAALLGLVLAVVLDLVLLRTRLLRSRDFWTAYGIVLVFQLVVNGVLTRSGTVTYDRDTILGPRLAFAPVEDLLFGFSLVLQTLSWWDFFGQRSAAARSTARRGRGTATRRSSTR
jgi:lycopene cyclase domain-containing protein